MFKKNEIFQRKLIQVVQAVRLKQLDPSNYELSASKRKGLLKVKVSLQMHL